MEPRPPDSRVLLPPSPAPAQHVKEEAKDYGITEALTVATTPGIVVKRAEEALRKQPRQFRQEDRAEEAAEKVEVAKPSPTKSSGKKVATAFETKKKVVVSGFVKAEREYNNDGLRQGLQKKIAQWLNGRGNKARACVRPRPCRCAMRSLGIPLILACPS